MSQRRVRRKSNSSLAEEVANIDLSEHSYSDEDVSGDDLREFADKDYEHIP